VFELEPGPAGAWIETVLYSFPYHNGVNGATPWASPVVGARGAIYGTTAAGGTLDQGSVFELQPAPGGTWTESVLYSFDAQNGVGYEPQTGLIIGPNGVLYGATQIGGAYLNGTVFELQPPADHGGMWTANVLHSFGSGDDGVGPLGLTLGANGVLFGVTALGGSSGNGTVFELSPPAGGSGGAWTETVLYSFMGGADGCAPEAAPVLDADGSLYGTTYGTVYDQGFPLVVGAGTAFKLTPPDPQAAGWSKTILRALTKGDGPGPESALLFCGQAIYGTLTYYGYGGAVFELQKPAAPGDPWTETILHKFGNGKTPEGNLVMGKDGAIYGATIGAFPNGPVGAIYRARP
jgi:hypothetical protein